MLWIAIALLILSIFLYSPVKNYYKSKTVLKQAESISARNNKFIHKNIKYIIEYFTNDTDLNLIVNYKNDVIVGFFISVKNDCYLHTYLSPNIPTTSYELEIDEFCLFLSAYTDDINDRENLVKNIMREHLERLK